ncbi:hypothetical protein DFH07DRAFT_740344 [Mycena maculata]|uniref:Major facilitator superfamily (MFS) profile domain-containing protein n=1 Tax=Mycena maculata TaxID=230809 RepID=A0AAD7JBH5_9AGAR|nr:hypothetical protein DFH07DRAFT_740344 [Mycena maculata]
MTYRIINPLKNISKAILCQQAAQFCVEYGFQDHKQLFQMAALVAQNPDEFEELEELSDEERFCLRREITHKWHLPAALYYTVFITSLGAAIQGWDNTGANGANLSFPEEFGIADRPWVVGCVNSAPTVLGLMSAWLSDPLNDRFGRRGCIFITGLFCVFPVLGQSFTRNWWELLICRMLLGVGIGVKITTIPIMSAETVPANIRGGLGISYQTSVAAGIFIGFVCNLAFYPLGADAWRYQLGAAFIPAVPLLFLIWLVPESPRWLLKKGRYTESFASFSRLRNSPLQAARDLYYAHAQLVAEQTAFAGSTYRGRIAELFTAPRLRRATLASFIVMAAQQFSGIGIIAFYSSTIFTQAGYSARASLTASVGFGAVNFLFAFPALKTIDIFGRRNLLLLTFPNMAWCLFAAAVCFKINAASELRLPLIAFFIFLFTAFYSPGIGPVPAVYASECFPLSHRESGMAWSIFVNNTFSTVLGLTFPSMLAEFGPTGAFCFYGGLNLVATVMIFLGLPETKQRTLEELDQIFSVPTSRHAAYQLQTWLPWFVRRYVRWDQAAELEPLYDLDGVTREHFAAGTA